MIPKIIHYCWFGRNPLPPLAIKCIESWKKFLPDYDIKEWNEDNFDVNIIPYTKEAYEAQKYAFVSDYARFWILYNQGGIYFDTDVEVIKAMDKILERGAYMGIESATLGVAPGLGLACFPGLKIYKEIMEFYQTLHFRNPDGTLNIKKTVVKYTTDILQKHGFRFINAIQQVAGLTIYPNEYFCPVDLILKKTYITNNTYTIHHYMASWQKQTFKKRLKKYIKKILPDKWLLEYNKKKFKNKTYFE